MEEVNSVIKNEGVIGISSRRVITLLRGNTLGLKSHREAQLFSARSVYSVSLLFRS